jgi:hypothetical protein
MIHGRNDEGRFDRFKSGTVGSDKVARKKKRPLMRRIPRLRCGSAKRRLRTAETQKEGISLAGNLSNDQQKH